MGLALSDKILPCGYFSQVYCSSNGSFVLIVVIPTKSLSIIVSTPFNADR